MTRHQGKKNTADYSNQTGSNNDVFTQVSGIIPNTKFWLFVPSLHQFDMKKFPSNLNFKHEDLDRQSTATRKSLYQQCDDVILGSLMTQNSIQYRFNMYMNVHKNMLANHPYVFATNMIIAMDQLIEYKELNYTSTSRSPYTRSRHIIIIHSRHIIIIVEAHHINIPLWYILNIPQHTPAQLTSHCWTLMLRRS